MKNNCYKIITPLLSFITGIMMLLNTMSITFNYKINQDNEIIRFSIFSIDKITERLDDIFGIAAPKFAFDILWYLSFIILIGFLLIIILFIINKIKIIIPVIVCSSAIIINILYIIAANYINRLIIIEEPFGIVSLSSTIWPFLIIITSSIIIYISIIENKNINLL